MPLSVGDRLGPYEVLEPIGAGGMGEIYRSKDTKLKREVAIKVLPEAFACDPERMARFQREAEVLASLNHPNIANAGAKRGYRKVECANPARRGTSVESRMGASTGTEAPPRFPSPLIKPDVPN
jgi:serine/threonine protein kinase